MNPFLILILVAGIAVLVFGILTFNGKTSLSNRSYRIGGVDLDSSVTGIALFFLGMLLIIIFLIAVVGPHFTQEGL